MSAIDDGHGSSLQRSQKVIAPHIDNLRRLNATGASTPKQIARPRFFRTYQLTRSYHPTELSSPLAWRECCYSAIFHCILRNFICDIRVVAFKTSFYENFTHPQDQCCKLNFGRITTSNCASRSNLLGLPALARCVQALIEPYRARLIARGFRHVLPQRHLHFNPIQQIH